MIFALSTINSVDTGHPLVTSALKREIMSAICMIFLHTVENPAAVEVRKCGRPLVRCWWSATVDSWRARAWDVAAHKGCIISIFNLHWHIFHSFNLDNHQHRWSLISDTISSISRDIIEQNSAKKTKTRKPQKIISGPNNSTKEANQFVMCATSKTFEFIWLGSFLDVHNMQYSNCNSRQFLFCGWRPWCWGCLNLKLDLAEIWCSHFQGDFGWHVGDNEWPGR